MEEAKKERLKEAFGNQTDHVNFFKPLNEMDPLRAKLKDEYRLDCNLFHMNEDASRKHYSEVMNKCLSGDYLQGIKETHFTKDGEMLVYLEWMDIIKAKPPVTEVKDSEINKEVKKKRKGRPKKDLGPVLPFDLEGAEALKLIETFNTSLQSEDSIIKAGEDLNVSAPEAGTDTPED